jgi:hypothetical protein
MLESYPGFAHKRRAVGRAGDEADNPVAHRPYIILIPLESFFFIEEKSEAVRQAWVDFWRNGYW